MKLYDATNDQPVYRTQREALQDCGIVEHYTICGMCGEQVTPFDALLYEDESGEPFYIHKEHIREACQHLLET